MNGKLEGFLASSFFTIYLAPHNYHRVHSPLAGKLESITYIPGDLWPVNPPVVKQIPRVFSRNERVVFEIITENNNRVFW